MIENSNVKAAYENSSIEVPHDEVDDRPITPMELAFARLTKLHAVYDNEAFNIEDENDFICFSDIKTRKIIRVVASDGGAATQLFGPEHQGKKCYEVIQGRTSPCPFCSNRNLHKDRYHIWQSHNEITDKDYLHKTKMVKLDGEYVRMDVSQDITDDARKAVLLAETLEGMSLWTECVSLLSGDISLQEAIEFVIAKLGEYFGASSGLIALYGSNRYLSTWAAKGEYEMPPLFVNPTQAALDEWGKLLVDKPHARVPDTSDPRIPEPLRNFFASKRITTTQLSPIFVGDGLRGVLCLNNVSRNKTQVFFADMIAQTLAHSFQRAELRDHMNRLQFHDPLTGCLNLEGFRYAAEELIRENPDKHYALGYADIRRFKYINDMFGYEVGDGFLLHMAKVFTDETRHGEAFCRISADNVAALFYNDTIEEEEQRFERISSALAEFPGFDDRSFTPELVCGVYLLTEEDVRDPDINKMMNRANIAQKGIKGLLGSRITFYDETLRQKQLRELEISQHLERGMESDEFYIVLQPQVDYASEKIVGAEALIRWEHPELGSISPGEFIPLLEKAGLISRLDAYVWEEACKFLRHILDTHGLSSVIPVSVNISRIDIYLPDLVEILVGLVRKYDLPTELLKLEITESAYIADSDQLIEVVSNLRDQGFSVEMDDFGSGYSSLNVLKDVPVDVLKLDMKFLAVDDSRESRRGGSILSSVVRMAHNISLPVIAEGVETKEQADYLASVGCYMMQGYYFARPMPLADFETLLAQQGAGEFAVRKPSGNVLGSTEFLSANGATSYLFNNCIGAGILVEFDGKDFEGLLINEPFYETVGARREDIDSARTHMIDLFVEEDQAVMTAGLQEAVDKGSSLIYARIRARKNGYERWLRGINRYLTSSDGKHTIFTLVEDVTEQRLAEIKLQNMENQLRSVIELVPGGLFRYVFDGENDRFDYVNEGLLRMLGYTQKAFENKFDNRFSEIVYPEDRERVEQMLEVLSEDGSIGRVDYRIETATGELRWFRDERRIVADADGIPWCYAILTDMGAQRPANISQRWQTVQYYVMAEMQRAILYDYDPVKDEMTYCSTDGNGEPEEVVFSDFLKGKKLDRVHPDDRDRYILLFSRALKEKTSGSLEFRAKYFRPDYSWCRSTYVCLTDEEGNLTRLVGRVSDIEEEKNIQQLINRDSLTGFLNQSATKASISAALEEKQQGAFFVIDIDDFKAINDTLGHLFGDSFLREVSESLAKLFRDEDLLGRIGGDEFVAFVPGDLDRDVVEKKAQNILEAFGRIEIPQIGAVHASVGVALVEGESFHDYASLFKKADRALYQAKQKGKNCFVIFESEDTEVPLLLPLATRAGQATGKVAATTTWSQALASDVFSILYSAEKTHDGINEALAHVGQWLGVSRVYVFKLKGDLMWNTFEWCNTGIRPEIDNLQDIPVCDENGENPYKDNFDMDGIFYLRYAEDLPAWQREVLEPQNIKSMLQYGYMEQGELVGFIGFDECNENVFWTKDQINDLVRIAQIISVFLAQIEED